MRKINVLFIYKIIYIIKNNNVYTSIYNEISIYLKIIIKTGSNDG